MTQQQTCLWTGRSGRTYTYRIFPLPPNFVAKPGNYIFANVVSGQWNAIYVGETEDLSTRFDAHHAAHCSQRHGATHVHAHVNETGSQGRRDEEADIRYNYNPPCNQQ